VPPRLVFVIPTRNRADIAQASLLSVLAAGATDVRVIVSDNSTDRAQSAALEEACARHDRERVSYVRPHASLSMTDHWTWALERALEDPSVEFVSYLTDRMTLACGELSHVLAALDMAPGRIVSYNHEHIDDLHDPVHVVPNECSGRLIAIPSSALIRLAARGQRHMSTPRMLNTVVPRALLDAIAARFGSVFASASPDFAFAFRALATVDDVAFLDRPVLIEHSTRRSNGTSTSRGIASPDGADFVRIVGGAVFAHAPAPHLRTISNAVFSEYCFVRSDAPEVFPPLLRRDYLATIARDLRLIEDRTLAERTLADLRALGWSARAERQSRARDIASLARFYGRRPLVAARRARHAATGTSPAAPRAAASIEAAMADLEQRPVPFNDDGALLRQLLDAGARLEVLGAP
jgi:hypothetical protein